MVFPGSAENRAHAGLSPCWSTRLQGLLQGVKGVTIYLHCGGCGLSISLEPHALAVWTALGASRAWFLNIWGSWKESWIRWREIWERKRERGEVKNCAVDSQGATGLAWPSYQPSLLCIPQSFRVKWAKYKLLMLHLTSCFKTAWTCSKVHVNVWFFWSFWNGGEKSAFIRCWKYWGSLALAGTEQEEANPKQACGGEVGIVYALFSHKSRGKVRDVEMTPQMGSQLFWAWASRAFPTNPSVSCRNQIRAESG